MSNPSRVSAGVPTGGQFATQAHAEPDLHLVNVEGDVTHTDPAAHMNTMSIPRPPKPGQSLAQRFPNITAQWHPTRNSDRTPDQVTAGSHTKVWWRCDLGHEWEAETNSRTSGGHGCPVCAGRTVLAGYNDLATTFPDVAAQWHPTRNADRTPDQVSAGVVKKVWWRCEQGHEWEAKIKNRTTGGHGCPVCAGRTVLAGFNDLGTRFPDVAAQWHPTRNGDLTPDQVHAGTDVKAWWRCEQGHEWEAAVRSRTTWGLGCPVHSGQKLLAGYNDLGTRFPDVAAQWHPTRNADRTPDQVLAGTDAKAWWRCKLGHEWEAAVSSRTRQGFGCPVCTGRKVLTGFNDLTTASPDTAKQWHPTRNGDLTPDRVTAGSGKRVWWRCEQGHEWEAVVNGRTTNGSGCPVCAGQKLLVGYNELATRFPDTAKQWHPTRNADHTPDQVLAGSGEKVWWRCELGHEWETTVGSRTRQSTGCSVCSGRKAPAWRQRERR